jgi:flavodoxin I
MIAILYGSSTLNTEFVAQRVLHALGEDTADLHNVKNVDPGIVESRSSLIFITSTWGAGDLQDDWELLLPLLERVDMNGKTIGLVGVGDQVNYPDAFCDSIAILDDLIRNRGGVVVGRTPTEGYRFKKSRAVRKGSFVGLVLDEDNQSDKTDERIATWIRDVRPRLLRRDRDGRDRGA